MKIANKLLYMKQIGSFLTLVYHLFYEPEPHFFFPFIRKIAFFDARFENYLSNFSNGLTGNFEYTNTYHIMTMNLILGSGSRIILVISLLLNHIDEINFSVLFNNVERSLLELFIKEHCSVKKITRKLLILMT